jgi:COMPASS component BRE2
MNRRGFRYTPCEASHLLPALSYRGTEYEPFAARINFEDMNAQVYVNTEGTGIATPKGWRMARANVGVREGEWYFECKVLSGINGDDTSGGHVRVGWARREGSILDIAFPYFLSLTFSSTSRCSCRV